MLFRSLLHRRIAPRFSPRAYCCRKAANITLLPSYFASLQSANEIAMAPKRKNQNSVAVLIPPIDSNSQLPFAGNHMSVVSESDLLHLVDVGILPPKELCSWRTCRGVTVPIEDTHESVVYVPFLIRGLALPISPFFRGLLDFYNLNLTHLNPNLRSPVRGLPRSSSPLWFMEVSIPLSTWDGWGSAPTYGWCESGNAARKENEIS